MEKRYRIHLKLPVNGLDLNYFMLVFDAHGKHADEYYMSNLKVEVDLE